MSMSVPESSEADGGSYVWKYFKLLSSATSGQSSKCKCTLCGRVLSYHGTTRGSLRRHLRYVHVNEVDEREFSPRHLKRHAAVEPLSSVEGESGVVQGTNTNECSGDRTETQPRNEDVTTATSFVTKSRLAAVYTPTAGGGSAPAKIYRPKPIKKTLEKDEIDGLVLRLMTSVFQSLSLVESKDFRNIMEAFIPLYEVPNCEELTKQILPRMHAEVQQDVKNSLEGAEKIAVCVECWVSRHSQHYITVAAHFLSSSWEKKSPLLCTTQTDPKLSGLDVAVQLKKIFESWEIQDKILAVVAKSSCCGSPPIEEAIHNLGLEYVPCFVSELDRMVGKSVESADDVVAVANKVRWIASYFHYWCDEVSLPTRMQATSIPLKDLLPTDDEGRWISTLKMFQRYISKHEDISAALCCLGKTKECITETEVDVIERTLESLEPFQLAAEELCVENRATLSAVIPVLKQLQECLSKLQHQDFALTLELSTELDNLTLSLESNVTVGISTVLDPCFKCGPFSDSVKVKDIKACITSMLTEMYGTASTDSGILLPKEEPQPQKKSFWSMFDSKVNDILESSSPSNKAVPAIELEHYLGSRRLRRLEEHPYEWWKSNETLMPSVGKLAKQFLSVPASSFPATRIFSKSKAHESFLAKRSCLEDSCIDKILFLNNYFALRQL